jgi:hypothetical protein
MAEVKIITIELSELEALIKKAVAEAIAEHQLAITSNNTRECSELIGTAEACKILGCCARTMQRYRDLRCFSVIMRGPKKALYYRREIEAFRDANRIEAN